MKTTKLLAGFLFAAALTASSTVFAQVKIGDNPATIDPSAVLDLESTNKGLLPPRLALQSLQDATTIPTPATGLLVYNTNAGLKGGTGIFINTGTPASPVWGKFEPTTPDTGGSTHKLVYRGTTDGTKTIIAGLFEFRYLPVPNSTAAAIQVRLISQPNQNIALVGQRLGWYQNGSNASEINFGWSTSDWNQWKNLDLTNSQTSFLYHLYVTGSNDNLFYRISDSYRTNDINALIIDIY